MSRTRLHMLALAASDRHERQHQVMLWCARAFGAEHAASVPQRALRMAEEAIEASQAAGVDRELLHKLVNYIYSRPVGDLKQELGGVGVTLLALAAAAGVGADDAERDEIERILALPLSHFTARNERKNAAGFGL